MRFLKGDCCHGAASRGFAPALQRLFFFVAAMLVCTAALGDEVTFNCSSSTLSGGTNKSLESNGVKITFSSISSASTSSGGYVTCKQNTTLTVSSDNTISGIVVNYQRENGVSDVTSAPGSVTNNGNQSNWTGSANSVEFTFAGSSDVRVSSIVVTYTTLPAPTLSFAEGVTTYPGAAIAAPAAATVSGSEAGHDFSGSISYDFNAGSTGITYTPGTDGAIGTFTAATATGTATLTAKATPDASETYYGSASKVFTITVAAIPAPVISPGAGSYVDVECAPVISFPEGFKVAGAEIWYTTDESAPNSSTTRTVVKYPNSANLAALTENTTVKAVIVVGAAEDATTATYYGEVVSNEYIKSYVYSSTPLAENGIPELVQKVYEGNDETKPLLLTVTVGDGKTDNWKGAKEDSGITDCFGSFRYTSMGKDDAYDEFEFTGYNVDGTPIKADSVMYKNDGNRDQFDLPITGSFFRFEPEVDGVVYMCSRQNGAPQVNDNNGDIDYARLRRRGGFVLDETGKALPLSSFYIPRSGSTEDEHPMMAAVDADGALLTLDETNTSAEGVKAYVVAGSKFDGIFDGYTDDAINGATGSSATATNIKESLENLTFYKKALIAKGTISTESEAIDGKTAHMIYTVKDGFMTLSKANVCYEFPVKAGKTYFVTAYQTKLSYGGWVFMPATRTDDNTTTVTLNEGGLDNANVNTSALVDDNKGKLFDEVTVNRTFEANQWYTLVLPFSVSEKQTKEVFGDDVTIIHFNGYNPATNDINLVMHKYQMIVAGTPLMINVRDGKVENPKFKNITFADNYTVNPLADRVLTSGYSFTGSYEPTTISAGNNYFIDRPTGDTKEYFVKCTIDQPIRALRAWLTNDGTGTSSNLNIKVDGEDLEGGAATEIINAMMGETTAVSGNVYNMQGQLVRQGTTMLNGLGKGVYIVNGKKVIVK